MADQICKIIDFQVDGIFVKFQNVYFVRLLEYLWEQIKFHFWLTYFFTHMKVIFQTV